MRLKGIKLFKKQKTSSNADALSELEVQTKETKELPVVQKYIKIKINFTTFHNALTP